MNKCAIIILLTFSAHGFAQSAQNRNLTGNVECLKALEYSAEGKLHNVSGPMLEDKVKAVGFKGDYQGKHGVFIYTGNSAKFFEFPSNKSWFGSGSVMNVDINGESYSIRSTGDPEFEKLIGTVFVDKPEQGAPKVAGKDILDDSTANLLADEVRNRTEQVWPNLKRVIENNNREAHPHSMRSSGFDTGSFSEMVRTIPSARPMSQEDKDHFIGSYVKALQTCQDNLILSQKASSDLADMKAMDTSKVIMFDHSYRGGLHHFDTYGGSSGHFEMYGGATR